MAHSLMQLVALQSALAFFDGEMVPVRNKADEAIGMERRPAPISIDTALTVARMQAAIKPHIDRFNDTRAKLVSVATGGKAKLEQDDPKFGAIQGSVTELLNAEVAVEVPRLSYAAVKDAKLAPSVLSALLPFLDGLPS